MREPDRFFNAVRSDLENIRAVYGELTWRSPAREFADLNLP